jgi:hypothetical protein
MLAGAGLIAGTTLKALSGKSKAVGKAKRESRKRRPGNFRPMTNRVEGTLHPAGIRIGPDRSSDRAISAI